MELDRDISGKVSDADSGEPLIGATIQVQGTSIGTITDADGNFNLTVSDGASVLVVSYIGFKSLEIAIGNQVDFDISLKPDLSSLEEVVVIGYGTQKKINLTGAVGIIDSETLESRPITQTSQALYGAVPGVL